jgi:hypothetical protein
MHHGQAKLEGLFDLERFKAAFRLPRPTILIAQDAGSRGEIGSADAPKARLLTPHLARTNSNFAFV